MGSEKNETTGRSWADIIVALPKYLLVLLLALVVIMIVRADLSNGITEYGFLGSWGRESPTQTVPEPVQTVNYDAITETNARLTRQLQCAALTMQGLGGRINEWKNYMELTAETFSNHALRQSRTATWKADVDDVLRQFQTVQQFISGQRTSC
ncbi:MAG: hypothetical protein Kilf2KO_34870 [Rhodospirillales bacterium]